MINADFEGYTGGQLYNTTFSNDMLVVIVLLLLTAFAWIFRLNVPLFGKMINNINAGEKVQSIFATTEKESLLIHAFMTFQTLLLFCVFLFSVAVKYRYIIDPDIEKTLLSLSVLLALFFTFYLFKRTLYALFGTIFIEKSAKKMMFTNYQALFGAWGITLYLPVFCILLFSPYFFIPLILLAISYLVFRSILIFRFIHIFFNKKTGLLFLSLYLCAQEIVPLVFLYEGMIYTYNFIEI